MIGKPYSGKPDVRFDEGELEIEHGQASEALPDERGSNGYAVAKPLRQLSTLQFFSWCAVSETKYWSK